jgi:hypothetical protein
MSAATATYVTMPKPLAAVVPSRVPPEFGLMCCVHLLWGLLLQCICLLQEDCRSQGCMRFHIALLPVRM